MKISFIGYGNMAKSIASQLAQHGQYSLAAASPSLTIGINKQQIHTHHDNKEIIHDAEIIILAVKPKQMSDVLKEIMPFIPSDCLLISVAAGLTLPWFAKHCNTNQAIIRTMPNTPSSVGLGATPMIANEYTSASQKKKAELIFSQIGITTWVDHEENMDVFTALSGSGPAYVFLFIETMINAAVTLGLDQDIAKKFTLQTFIGALNLVQNSDMTLNELRTKVTSPNGTTAAALTILNEKLDDLLFTAMSAAKNRAHELGSLDLT